MSSKIYTSAVLTAPDQFTDEIQGDDITSSQHSIRFNGMGNVSISGSFTGKITLQRRYAGKTDWKDAGSFTAAVEDNFYCSPTYEYRIGVKSSDTFTGSAEVSIDFGV